MLVNFRSRRFYWFDIFLTIYSLAIGYQLGRQKIRIVYTHNIIDFAVFRHNVLVLNLRLKIFSVYLNAKQMQY